MKTIMLQRKQTIFLLLAFVLTIVCLCMPVGMYLPASMEASSVMFNLWVKLSDGTYNFSVWPMFVVLLFSGALTVTTIFAYKNRVFQSRLCLMSMLLMFAWYPAYIVYGFAVPLVENATFIPSLVAALPFINVVLLIFARRSILADEAMVRAADRIR
ncbi:DUF4293 domain-containing protein [Prevotella koreensis]